jgi:hypothetical protein
LEKFFRRKIDEKMNVGTVINEIASKLKSPQRASDEVFIEIAHSEWSLTQLSEGRKHKGKS